MRAKVFICIWTATHSAGHHTVASYVVHPTASQIYFQRLMSLLMWWIVDRCVHLQTVYPPSIWLYIWKVKRSSDAAYLDNHSVKVGMIVRLKDLGYKNCWMQPHKHKLQGVDGCHLLASLLKFPGEQTWLWTPAEAAIFSPLTSPWPQTLLMAFSRLAEKMNSNYLLVHTVLEHGEHTHTPGLNLIRKGINTKLGQRSQLSATAPLGVTVALISQHACF